MKTSQPPKAILFARVSTPGQAVEGTSLESQEASCLRKAAAENAQVVAIYREEGISGGLYLARPDIQAALQKIESGEANLLIFPKVDRVGRTVDVIHAIKRRVERAGGRLVFADGMDYGSNAVGNFTFTQMAAIAELEKETIRERTMSGCRRRAEEGIQPCRRFSPFGYHLVTKADVLTGAYPPGTVGTYQPLESLKWAGEMFARCDNGHSLRQIAQWLQDSGVLTGAGKPVWYPNVVRGILTNPVYKGQAAYGRREHVTDESRLERGYKRVDFNRPRKDASSVVYIPCPAVVDEATWNRCQERLRANQEQFSGNPGRRKLLTGLLRCPRCRRTLNGTVNGGHLYYKCRFANPSSNPRGIVCANTHYKGAQAEEYALRGFYDVAADTVDAAFAAFKRERQNDDGEAALAAVERELAALGKEEAATVTAQIAGVQAGASPALYAARFAELAERRGRLEARRAEAAARRRSVEWDLPADMGALLEQALAALREVMAAPEITTAEKNAALARVVKEIYPTEDGYRLRLPAPRQLPGQTVMFIEVCSVSNAPHSTA